MSKLPSKSIPFGPPDISELVITEAIKFGCITTGSRTKQLEKTGSISRVSDRDSECRVYKFGNDSGKTESSCLRYRRGR